VRSLCSFFRKRLASFTNGKYFSHASAALEEMVKTKIEPGLDSPVSLDDLVMAIRILLNATTTQAAQSDPIKRRPRVKELTCFT
jgi:hypothetical protein